MKTVSIHDIPSVNREQMIEVDRLMIEHYQISLIQMMENAGRNLALLACRRFLADQPKNRAIAILAGSGGNGGGALVAARHLHNWGAKVTVFLSKSPARMTPVPSHQLSSLQHMNVPGCTAENGVLKGSFDLIIDGLIGYSLNGAPKGTTAVLIEQANAHTAPVLSLDVPSGLSANAGGEAPASILAAATLTLALPKQGLFTPEARAVVGEIYLADISVPTELYQSPSLQLEVPTLFGPHTLLRLIG